MTGALSIIAASGLNPFRNFAGGFVSSLSAGTPNAGVTLNDDGTCSFNSAGGSAPSSQWFTPTTASIGSSYWARATLNSGSLSSGTAGTWQAISGFPGWARNRTTVGTSTANITVQVATDSGGANIVASATFSLSAEKF